MAAYCTGNVIAASVPTGGVAGWGTWNVPNFVGELFKLSPLDTPVLTMIGGMSGGRSLTRSVETWQDTIHRAPAVQANVEGDDATFATQGRSERKNTTMIHQYGLELSYAKQAATSQLGTVGDSPATTAVSILGIQPVGDERAWQLQIKLEQAALDIEKVFLDGSYANPNDGTARQTQGIVGAVSTDTSTNWTGTAGQTADRDVINDLSKKLFDNGARKGNCVIMVNSTCKLDIGASYALDTTGGWNVQPRSMSVFGVNATTIETEFGAYPVVLNRHLDDDTVLILDLSIMAPMFMPTPGKGHFFLEPLAKAGSYDRDQLYGDIGLLYGPSGWHAKAYNLHA
jgi:hypothetical protein